ncbi:MAG: desulfoferrodoxin [Ruminococcus sp.]|nr:desulfoferrodoxin [Ruminococcus sp.]
MKFYICEHCGNIITKVKDKGVPVKCCGQNMTEIVPDTVDAAKEKHVPVVQVEDGVVSVSVGSVAHPMVEEHFIEWICVETKQGMQIKYLAPAQEPAAKFAVSEDDEYVATYAYCNLHGLWKA